MQSNISISSFKWEDTNDVIEFLNKVGNLKNTEKEISKEFFTGYHKLPGSNPLVDSFLAKRNDNKIIGFMHLIYEEKISRIVAITNISNTSQTYEIFTKFMSIAQDFATSNKVTVLHTQIKSDSTIVDYIDKDWIQVKEYWDLKCDREKGLSKLKNFNSPRPFSSISDNYISEPLDLNTGIKDLTSIQNISFENHWGFCPNTEEEIKGRIEITNPNQEGVLLIKDQDNIAGYNWTIFVNRNGHSGGWISMTGVSPKYRGLGLGRSIVMTGMQYLFDKGADYVELEVDSSNLPAVNLYKSLGFTKRSETVWLEKTKF